MHAKKIGLKNKLRKKIIMDKEGTSDGPAFAGALVAAAAGKAVGRKSRAKRKARRAKRKARKAGRMEKRADRAEARGNTKRAGILKAKAGAKREKSEKLSSRSKELKEKAASSKEKRKALGSKIKDKVKSGVKKAAGAVAGKVEKTVKDAKKDISQAKSKVKNSKVVKVAKKVKKVAKAAVAGAKEEAMAMYGKKGPASYIDTDPDKIAKREEKGQGVDLGAQSMDAKKEEGMSMYDGKKKEEKYDMKKAYDKNLSGDARLHYLENARADKDSKPKGGFARTGMKGPSMMGKIKYGQSSKPTYSKGNGRPAKGLSMMGHPSFIKGGKKKK